MMLNSDELCTLSFDLEHRFNHLGLEFEQDHIREDQLEELQDMIKAARRMEQHLGECLTNKKKQKEEFGGDVVFKEIKKEIIELIPDYISVNDIMHYFMWTRWHEYGYIDVDRLSLEFLGLSLSQAKAICEIFVEHGICEKRTMEVPMFAGYRKEKEVYVHKD